MKKATVAVAGNPNCGKTTLFNGLTGSTQHIGNWPGVTVEKKTGKLLGNNEVEVVDLPGIYSLNAVSEDELVARDFMLSGKADLVVNIADASNLERNMFLTLTLLEMRIPIILVLNMMDIAEKRGIRIDTGKLSRTLGIPVFSISALNGNDIRDIRRSIEESLENRTVPDFKVNYPGTVEHIISKWSERLEGNPRFTSILLFEEDEEITEKVLSSGALSKEEIEAGMREIEESSGDTPDIVIAESKYRLITSIAESCTRKNGPTGPFPKRSIPLFSTNGWVYRHFSR